MKFALAISSLTIAVALGGCAAAPQTATADAQRTAANNERCNVTGSNLPRKDCRGDVSVLPPSATEKLLVQPPGQIDGVRR